ncbi:curlin repeat-containing protein [Belliella sp. DSM 107340]|uniref:Curlin repeat-containing protein n=1 Tax=Belliella calami TaxID=2923436 RepID=A0ABS9UP20_9BACT|nr:curlin repeat-containing protein [Belliella calami]MCH7398375.1 curlin repeat-containing protein [Belliella calami]
MLKFLIFMMIVFSTGITSKVYAQESNSEDIKAYADSVRNAHLERAELLKKEIKEKQAAYRAAMKAANSTGNTVVINNKFYTSKDSLQIDTHEGVKVKSMGEGNKIIIDNNGEKSTVIVTQSGNGNSASVSQSTTKPKKANQENP